jgi:hypothetical protein
LQFRLAADVEQGALHAALLQFEFEWGQPVVHVTGQRWQGVVADLPDAVAAEHDLDQPADIAPARHRVLLDAGHGGVGEVVGRRPGAIAHTGQQDRRFEDRDRVGGRGEVTVAAGGPDTELADRLAQHGAQMVADAAAHTTQGRLLLVLQENS